MPTELNKEIELEIAYVLFIDIVGYSKLVTSEQRRLLELLNQIVRESEHFRAAEAKGRLITVPTGDGMALVFYNTPEAPVECALEVSSAASEHSETAARQSYLQARSELQALLKEQPDNAWIMADLALAYMGLGDKAAAFRFAEQGIAANPVEKDAILGPGEIEALARVSAQMGEPERAISVLEKLLQIPGGHWIPPTPLTPALLRLDPMFDPLRNDPRFQKLCEEKRP
jgi:tetratricopeptide (TPR) repeat protein